ncbi:hypothetical protein Tco_0384692, partial [Tanacetum coccineum]
MDLFGPTFLTPIETQKPLVKDEEAIDVDVHLYRSEFLFKFMNQTDPSPRPSPSTIIPDSIPESSGGNLG